MLLAICTTQVKKKKKKKNKVTKNLLQGDSKPDVNASIHRTTSVKADDSSLKEV